ncbi:alpha/beta fold hydrolase [Schaalia sp. lx-100]|uniref:alpha/beta fold hydrolase n=1 Tax=Schaalia sp. lx-100 TaxID=2899081 RepID=UPI001E55B681|nr:alpha/beta fold hydrolase [Schaalia sp. lx-100]MCD4557917.1 alpha/beta hydrolase [Schaalia sp. lx-100]
MRTSTYRQHGCIIHEHRFTVPLDHRAQAHTASGTAEQESAKATSIRLTHNESIEIFVREVVPEGGENFPYLCYLQGGPGYGSPRAGDFRDGWLGFLLKKYRLVLLDQRGTGQSGRLDARSLCEDDRFRTSDGNLDAQALADYLMFFRQDQIVYDAEYVRHALAGGKPWTTLGQSFGGFITTSYLSLAPEGLEKCFITGGLPGFTHVDDIYRLTYQQTAARNRMYLRMHPSDERTIREIAAHVRDTEEFLPTGEQLTSDRFRMIGLGLGTQTRTDMLHYLLEGPWVNIRGQRRLSHQFLEDISNELAIAPMYAVLHETIYAGTIRDISDRATGWSADRLAQQIRGFVPDADPLDMGEPYYLTGEHMMRSLYQTCPALQPFAEAADILAQRTDWPCVYRPEVLADNDIPVVATVYYDDMFVPRELSMDTAALIRGTRTWVTNEYQHDGLRASGTRVLEYMASLLED